MGGEAQPPPTPGADFLDTYRKVASAFQGQKQGSGTFPDLEELDRRELKRAARAGKFSELAERLRLLHARHLGTLDQVAQLQRRVVELRPDSIERAEVDRMISRLSACAGHVVVHANAEHDYARLASGRFCGRHLLCPFCARLRGARLVRDYGDRIAEIFKRADAHTFKLMLITNTVRNGPNLRERFDALVAGWNELQRRRRNHESGHRGWSTLSDTLGGVASIEVKRGSGSGEWHPHIHALVIVPTQTDAAELQRSVCAEWLEVTGDSHICDVRDVHPGEDVTSGFHSAFCEVFKYATKGGGMTPEDACDAWLQLARAKFVRPWGWLFGLREPTELGDVRDRVDFDLLELVYLANETEYGVATMRPVDPRELDRVEKKRRNREIYMGQWLHKCSELDRANAQLRGTMSEALELASHPLPADPPAHVQGKRRGRMPDTR